MPQPKRRHMPDETNRMQSGRPRPRSIRLARLAAFVLLITIAGSAQQKPAPTQAPWADELKKYPGLMEEFGRLQTRMSREVQAPADRPQSRLLALLPATTVLYAALPNYGDALHQALSVFQSEREQSAVLRDWWQHGPPATNGPKIEEYLQGSVRISQYLGDEIVVAERTSEDRAHPSLLVLAEVRKPGLKDVLQSTVKQFSEKSNMQVRILDLQDLASAKEGTGKELLVLVRPDFVVAGLDLATMRDLNARIENHTNEFASTPFGQRVLQAYEGATSVLIAADLQKILDQAMPADDLKRKNLDRTGFGDVKFLVWEHKRISGQAAGQVELSFNGPRRGAASWLGAPAHLGSFDFVSQKAVIAGAVMLKNPTEIYDDLVAFGTASNPNAFASVAQMEQALKINLKQDLLGQLGGEIGFEMDTLAAPIPAWKAMLSVKDADHLQSTLNALLAATQMKGEKSEENGLPYQVLRIPSATKNNEIHYVFVDGYLIVASSHEALVEAVRIHKSGESLAKSESFLSSIPPGHSSEASALLYEDPLAFSSMTMRQTSPELADLLSNGNVKKQPVVMAVYGEPSAIREASKSAGVDLGAALAIGAIAIPNLLRARIAANESSAVSSLRTVNTAQITYAATYPERGFAKDLTTLGPGSHEPSAPSASHANFIESTLANVSCTAGDGARNLDSDLWSSHRVKLDAAATSLQLPPPSALVREQETSVRPQTASCASSSALLSPNPSRHCSATTGRPCDNERAASKRGSARVHL